jgi:hypothetical protein
MQIAQYFFRATAVAIFASAGTFGLHAQQGATAAAGSPSLFFAQPATSSTSLLAANDTPDSIGYSSSAGAAETADAVNFISGTGTLHAAMGMQPPPRRYGRSPVYNDSHHNSDGSNKYTFFGGAGFTVPVGGTHNYLSPSYNFQVGGGRNFNKKFAVLAQFDYAHFSVQDSTLNSLLATYVSLGATDGSGNALSQLNGTTHIWSFTLDPMYTVVEGEKAGAYVIGGVGYYHKVTDFTTPTEGYYYDPYYGLIPYQANSTIDSYVSNSVGFNGGAGFTYKPSRFGGEKFYAEARYVYTPNSSRPYYDGTNGTALSPSYFNVFPQNSAKTTFIPITFGIRF